MLRHQSQPREDLDGTTFESRFFPLHSDALYLHSHIGAAPLSPRRPSHKQLHLDVYQHLSCTVQSIKVSTDYGKTLAKAVLRYRTLAIAWPIGWAAALFCLQLHVFGRSGESKRSTGGTRLTKCRVISHFTRRLSRTGFTESHTLFARSADSVRRPVCCAGGSPLWTLAPRHRRLVSGPFHRLASHLEPGNRYYSPNHLEPSPVGLSRCEQSTS